MINIDGKELSQANYCNGEDLNAPKSHNCAIDYCADCGSTQKGEVSQTPTRMVAMLVHITEDGLVKLPDGRILADASGRVKSEITSFDEVYEVKMAVSDQPPVSTEKPDMILTRLVSSSRQFYIPKEAEKSLGFGPGAKVDVSIFKGRIEVSKHQR